MTAESLKPILSAPMAALSQECVDKKSVKRSLLICGFVLLFGLIVLGVGLEIWNIARSATLQREVDSLKQQLQELRQLRNIEHLEDFDEFEEAYNGADHASEEYGDEFGEERDDELDEGSGSDFGSPDDFPESDDMETEISVHSTSNSIDGGKRRARSISGTTNQGVPIFEESYMNRQQQLNRSRHQHHQQIHRRGQPQYQQMRQRPEEVVSPPPLLTYKWDDESDRQIPSHHQLDSGTATPIVTGRHRINSEHRRRHHQATFSTTTPRMPSSAPSSAPQRSPKSSNLVGPDFSTKPPGPTHDRRSRVMMTNAGRAQKMTRNLNTARSQRYSELDRSASSSTTGHSLHLVKSHYSNQSHLATDHIHWPWQPVDPANHETLHSNAFHLSRDGLLKINDSGVYFVYAQLTYHNDNPTNGFSIIVNGKRRASCSIDAQAGKKTNTCYTASLIDLDRGSSVGIREIGHHYEHLAYPDKSFFGLYKLRPRFRKGQGK